MAHATHDRHRFHTPDPSSEGHRPDGADTADAQGDTGHHDTDPGFGRRRRSADGLQLSPADVRNLRIFGKVMDNAIELPGVQQKVGLDALIGVLPIAGDGVSFALSLYPLVVAYRAGAGPVLLAKMGGNLLLDFLVGLIPVLGDLFDVAFKANVRNLRLLGIDLDGR